MQKLDHEHLRRASRANNRDWQLRSTASWSLPSSRMSTTRPQRLLAAQSLEL
jgi:hypothetical protein